MHCFACDLCTSGVIAIPSSLGLAYRLPDQRQVTIKVKARLERTCTHAFPLSGGDRHQKHHVRFWLDDLRGLALQGRIRQRIRRKLTVEGLNTEQSVCLYRLHSLDPHLIHIAAAMASAFKKRACSCRDRVQKEGEVIHVVAEHMLDLSNLLRSVGDREGPLSSIDGSGDEAKHGSRPEPEEAPALAREPRNIDVQGPRSGSNIRIKTRDFR